MYIFRSLLARFHPNEKSNLAIASSKGSVTVYDIHQKSQIYHNTDAHYAACRDLAMSKSLSDTLISVSYDCNLNIFDLRRQTVASKIKYISPLTTVALSDCGTYFCVGTLNGELLTGDMRNTKSFMHTKRVHRARVQRVAFVPIVANSVQPELEPADTVRPDSGHFCWPVVRRDSFSAGNHEVATLGGSSRMSPRLEWKLQKNDFKTKCNMNFSFNARQKLNLMYLTYIQMDV